MREAWNSLKYQTLLMGFLVINIYIIKYVEIITKYQKKHFSYHQLSSSSSFSFTFHHLSKIRQLIFLQISSFKPLRERSRSSAGGVTPMQRTMRRWSIRWAASIPWIWIGPFMAPCLWNSINNDCWTRMEGFAECAFHDGYTAVIPVVYSYTIFLGGWTCFFSPFPIRVTIPGRPARWSRLKNPPGRQPGILKFWLNRGACSMGFCDAKFGFDKH